MMTTVRGLHEKAMHMAQTAMIFREQGRSRLANAFAKRAHRLETEAIALVPHEDSSEPTLSILYRSAASLAYQSGDYEAARKQVMTGLSGNPPSDIKEELEGLLHLIALVEGDIE